MFGIGGWEFMIIAVAALLLFGPDKLPQFARTIGRFMRDFKRYQDLMESTLRAEIYSTEPTADPSKWGKDFRKRVPESESAPEDEAESAAEAHSDDETAAAPSTPAERAASLPPDHPLASALAAGEDVGIDDDLDLSTLDASDLGWNPQTAATEEGVDGSDA